MFIAQTRLLRVASKAANGNITTINPPTEVATFLGMVRDVSEAMSYLTPATRPATDQWGGYVLAHDLSCSVLLNPIGIRDGSNGNLIILYYVWQTDALRLSGAPDQARNSHEFALQKGYSRSALRTIITDQIQAWIRYASLSGNMGTMDPEHLRVATEAQDPTGEFASIRDMKDTVSILTPPTPVSPVVSMVPK